MSHWRSIDTIKTQQFTMTTDQANYLRIFRLVDENSQANDSDPKAVYEEYKDSIEERAEGTCQWFLDQPNFKEHWLEVDSRILLVTADPGCGKSVLAKFLIDCELPRHFSQAGRPAAICYFFFKDPVQTDIKQALCALLYQLFNQRPHLLQHAKDECEKEKQDLRSNTTKLWSIFQAAIADKDAGQVICVLDALEECKDAQCKTLTKYLKEHFLKGDGKLKVLLTSRPYAHITSDFNELDDVFPQLRIKGEEESTKISSEISTMIPHRIKQLEKFRNMSIGSLDYITKRLQRIEHRTYLWLYLVFRYLETAKLTDKAFSKEVVENIPVTFNDAYEKILKRCEDGQSAKKIFKILLAAHRTLTIEEIQLAFEIDETSISQSDIDLENLDQFERRLRNICGLFISIHIRKVYFIHQSARELLLKIQGTGLNHKTSSNENVFAHSIPIQEANLMLAQRCVAYIKLRDWKEGPSIPSWTDIALSELDAAPPASLETPFPGYAVTYWMDHVRLAEDEIDEKMANDVLELFDAESSRRFFGMKADQDYWPNPMLEISRCGMDFVLKYALEKRELDPDIRDEDGHTPLFWAATMGNEAVVERLLGLGNRVNMNAEDSFGRTALLEAVEGGNDAVVEQFLSLGKRVNVDAEDTLGRTALHLAVLGNYKMMVERLLGLGNRINVNATDEFGNTALHLAVHREYDVVVEQFLSLGKGADVNATDRFGRTALQLAEEKELMAVVERFHSHGIESM